MPDPPFIETILEWSEDDAYITTQLAAGEPDNHGTFRDLYDWLMHNWQGD
jgi:hypothetical protein